MTKLHSIALYSIMLLLLSAPAWARSEKSYQNEYCAKWGGVVEVRLEDKTRVDCITDKYAIEFGFAGHFEDLDQALHYARLTGKTPAVAWIIRSEKDQAYLDRLIADMKYWKLPVKVFLIKK
jgi:hypothetical protein